MAARGRLWHRLLRNLWTAAKDAVFPLRCCGCDRLYRRTSSDTDAGDKIDLALFLCNRCRLQIDLSRSPLCSCCGRSFDAPMAVDHLCGWCLKDPFEFDMARSAGKYDRALKALVCRFKYDARPELAFPLGALLWQTFCLHWTPQDFDCIIPVPLHRRRFRQRGFNQAEQLIRHWPDLARNQGMPFEKDKIGAGILIRHRPTAPQTGLDRTQRSGNVKSAFKLTDPGAFKGLRVLLVDDVLTTGATVNACTRVLKKGKAASVKVLTLARAV